jgi:predicted nuclease of predicted toxin-antitoxin system
VRFLIDMPLSPALADWLKGEAHDAVHVAALGLHRATDTEIIARAVDERRTIVTADLDYPRLLALAHAEGPSLILFRGGDWSETELTARMQQLLGRFSETEIAGSVLVVSRDRLRRRFLPIA